MQFSLRSLLCLVALAAVDCWLLVSPPGWIPLKLWVFITYTWPAALITVAIWGSAPQRAFCIGALFPAATTFIYLSIWLAAIFLDEGQRAWYEQLRLFESSHASMSWFLGASLAISNIIGFVCLIVRWHLPRRDLPGE